MEQKSYTVMQIESNHNLAVIAAFELIFSPFSQLDTDSAVLVQLAVKYSMNLGRCVTKRLGCAWGETVYWESSIA
jgi:hypothetical protein